MIPSATVICCCAASGRFQLGELLVCVAALQASETAGLHGHAVVKQHGVDALQPLGALADDGLAQPHLDAQIEDMRRRDPRLWQAVVHQQLAQQARVEFVRLRAPLAVLTHPCLGGLGELDVDAGQRALLSDKPPPRHRLDGDDGRRARVARKERPDGLTVGRTDAAALRLTSRSVQRVVGDLSAMQVEPDEGRHEAPPRLDRQRGIIVRSRSDGTPASSAEAARPAIPTCDLSRT